MRRQREKEMKRISREANQTLVSGLLPCTGEKWCKGLERSQ